MRGRRKPSTKAEAGVYEILKKAEQLRFEADPAAKAAAASQARQQLIADIRRLRDQGVAGVRPVH